MSTDAEKQEVIEDIDTVLQTGLAKEASDGQSTELNHETLREERARLERQTGSPNATPGVFRFGRGGCA